MSEIPPDMLEGDPLILEFGRVLCHLHGEPFRATWPKGYAIACLELFQAACALDDCPGLAAEEGAGGPLAAEAKRAIEAWLDERPACCRITRGQLHGIYVRSAVGTRARCDLCSKRALGTRYETQQQAFEHMCFGCVCTNISATPWGAS